MATDALIETGNVPDSDIVKMGVEGAECARKVIETRKTIWIIVLHDAD